MKTIFVSPQGIRVGWRFAIFVFLLFAFSKLFFWLLTVLLHYQEHPGSIPAPRQGLDEAWIFRRISQRPTDLVDCGV